MKPQKVKEEFCGEYGVLNEDNLKKALNDGLPTYEIAKKFNKTITGLRS